MSDIAKQYVKQARVRRTKVFFTGTTALAQGVLVCRDWNYGTVTEPDGRRYSFVEMPSADNNRQVAGVTVRAYTANASGQMIEIYEPGSWCSVRTDQNVTAGNYLTARVSATASANGVFGPVGFGGRGTFQALESQNRSSGAGLVFGRLLDGEESGLFHSLNVGVGGTQVTTVGGVTSVDAVGTIAGHATMTLADGDVLGLVKCIKVEVDLGDTFDLVVTVANGVQHNGTTALTSITADDIGDTSTLVWCEDGWRLLKNTGSALG